MHSSMNETNGSIWIMPFFFRMPTSMMVDGFWFCHFHIKTNVKISMTTKFLWSSITKIPKQIPIINLHIVDFIDCRKQIGNTLFKHNQYNWNICLARFWCYTENGKQRSNQWIDVGYGHLIEFNNSMSFLYLRFVDQPFSFFPPLLLSLVINWCDNYSNYLAISTITQHYLFTIPNQNNIFLCTQNTAANK